MNECNYCHYLKQFYLKDKKENTGLDIKGWFKPCKIHGWEIIDTL